MDAAGLLSFYFCSAAADAAAATALAAAMTATADAVAATVSAAASAATAAGLSSFCFCSAAADAAAATTADADVAAKSTKKRGCAQSTAPFFLFYSVYPIQVIVKCFSSSPGAILISTICFAAVSSAKIRSVTDCPQLPVLPLMVFTFLPST